MTCISTVKWVDASFAVAAISPLRGRMLLLDEPLIVVVVEPPTAATSIHVRPRINVIRVPAADVDILRVWIDARLKQSCFSVVAEL